MKTGQASGLEVAFLSFGVMLLAVPSTSLGGTYTPSLEDVAVSSSARSALTTTRRPELLLNAARRCPSASTSSKNNTHGAFRRAVSKMLASARSLSPSKCYKTSAMPTA